MLCDGRCIAEAGVTGELVYSGPNVALGYAECGEDLANGDEWGGVLMTAFALANLVYGAVEHRRFKREYERIVNQTRSPQ